MDVSSFNDGSRNPPATPITVPLRLVVADLNSGKINTNLRFGRKPQWKLHDQGVSYMRTLLEGNIPIDSISMSYKDGVNRAINGNNRLRTIRSFVNNEFGIPCSDGNTYYYSTVPEDVALNAKKRKISKVLPDGVRNALDNYPIYMNQRRGLTEAEERHWYRLMNTNIKTHRDGQILLCDLCEEENPFVEWTLGLFPQIKPRIELPLTDEDDGSMCSLLTEKFGVEPYIHDRENLDKDDAALKSLATIANLLANGKPYSKGYVGEFKQDVADANLRTFTAIFEGVEFSDEVKELFKKGVTDKKAFMPSIWAAGYLLGAIAHSVANGKENAVTVWKAFLQSANAELLSRVYTVEGDAALKWKKAMESDNLKYTYVWEKVAAWYVTTR